MFKKSDTCYHRLEFGECGTGYQCYCEQNYRSLSARLGRMVPRITTSRFPWQWYVQPREACKAFPDPRKGIKYGWDCEHVLMRRFGGGWRFKLGIDVGGSAVILNVGIGIIRIAFNDNI